MSEIPAASQGPYLSMAVFCERVLEEKTGVLSIIRIIDRINLSAGADAPETMPEFPLKLTAVISIKSGFLKGKYTVTVKPQAPSGEGLPPVELPVLLEGDDHGANLVLRFAFGVREEGLYWFDVLVEETLLTRIPLRILYQRFAGNVSPRR